MLVVAVVMPVQVMCSFHRQPSNCALTPLLCPRPPLSYWNYVLCTNAVSNAGKVAERRWYERNKHIFPASRWEVYDPRVSREGTGYTIHGGEVNAKDKDK